jgi:membrane protease YdiL (CAAX protease family)
MATGPRKQSGWLPVYLIALCIVAPITEEIVVRGFLFRGWSQSFLGPIGAIVLTSAIWALVHTQYNLFYQAEVFTTGLLLGYLRHRNGSTLLTVAIHAAINIASAMELAWFLA